MPWPEDVPIVSLDPSICQTLAVVSCLIPRPWSSQSRGEQCAYTQKPTPLKKLWWYISPSLQNCSSNLSNGLEHSV